VELALIELPIAGMMSDERAEIVAAKAEKVLTAMAQCGCTINNAMIQHMFVALPVIPELRLTDMGLVDVTKFEFTSLFVSA
jgi:adenine deaminase